VAHDAGSAQPWHSVEDVAEIPDFERPLFVLAAPRSGGTLLYELLATLRDFWRVERGTDGIIEGIPTLHPASHGWDSHQLTEMNADVPAVMALKAALLAELRNSAGRRFLELPANNRPTRVRLIEKTSENALRIRFLSEAFPEARFVFVHRDGRQNVSSLLEAWHDNESIRIPFLPGWRRDAWHFLLPPGWRDYNDSPLVEVAAFQWATVNQCALDDLEWLARERWIVVDHAELVASPSAVVDRVLALTELEMDGALQSALQRPYPLSGNKPPSPIKWRNNPEFRESALAHHNVVRGRLRELGGPSAAPPPPRPTDLNVRFACFVNQLPLDSTDPNRDWIVHPSYHLQLGASAPLELSRRVRSRERFVRDFPVVWVKDDATCVLYPFWVQREHAHLLRQLRAGQPPAPIGSDLAAQLGAAGVLVTTPQLIRRRETGEALIQRAGPQFTQQRYCLLPSLIRTDHATALASYYDALIASGVWALGDAQVSQRHGWHNEPMARYFHHQLAQFISRVAGEPVRPSYCYVSAYRGGRASLRPHVDRKQCVFTASLWICDQAAGAAPWPLWLHTPDGVVSATQSAGDVVLFRGCELPHWRDQPPPSGASTTLIFHYVPQDFVGVLD